MIVLHGRKVASSYAYKKFIRVKFILSPSSSTARRDEMSEKFRPLSTARNANRLPREERTAQRDGDKSRRYSNDGRCEKMDEKMDAQSGARRNAHQS
uniref:Uncharacterized protein n=1 Tax=Plectus sambesii TaxID=2011161 RepID=A0A914W7R4_9BILA